jgi:hypothetical protein
MTDRLIRCITPPGGVRLDDQRAFAARQYETGAQRSLHIHPSHLLDQFLQKFVRDGSRQRREM